MDVEAQQFTQADVLAVIPGLKQPLLQAWIHRGHIKISDEAKGSGKRRHWSAVEIAQLAMMRELSLMRIPPTFAAKLLHHAADRFEERAQDANVGLNRVHLVIFPDRENNDLLATVVSDFTLKHVGLEDMFGEDRLVTWLRLDVLLDDVTERLDARLAERPSDTDASEID